MQIPREKPSNKKQHITLSGGRTGGGPISSKSHSKFSRDRHASSPTRAPHCHQGNPGDLTFPLSAALSRGPRAEREAGVRRFRPRPLPGARLWVAGQLPSARPLLPRGASPSASCPSRRQPAAHVQGGRREEGEERREGGRRKKGRSLDPGLPRACQERALSGSPGPSVPAAARAPLSHHSSPSSSSSSSSSALGAPRPLPSAAARFGLRSPPTPSRPHPQLSGVTPGTRVLAPSFLPSFLPLRPPSLSRSPARVLIVSVPSSISQRLALPGLSLSRTS